MTMMLRERELIVSAITVGKSRENTLYFDFRVKKYPVPWCSGTRTPLGVVVCVTSVLVRAKFSSFSLHFCAPKMQERFTGHGTRKILVSTNWRLKMRRLYRLRPCLSVRQRRFDCTQGRPFPLRQDNCSLFRDKTLRVKTSLSY